MREVSRIEFHYACCHLIVFDEALAVTAKLFSNEDTPELHGATECGENAPTKSSLVNRRSVPVSQKS
jgi:hypothetical protein